MDKQASYVTQLRLSQDQPELCADYQTSTESCCIRSDHCSTSLEMG